MSRFTTKVTEVREKPVVRAISARDIPGERRIEFKTSLSFACRNADFPRAPDVVKLTVGIES